MSSSIVIRTRFQNCKDLRKSVAKTINYISDKKKADSSSIDEHNLLKDYMMFADGESYLYEEKECFTWSNNGDINAKEDLKKIQKLDSKGTLWSLVVSFPPDFAINHGLITKSDYYQLTSHFMPTFLTEMGLKLDNVTWYCSLHRNTDNPHLHINFFEHKKTKTEGKIPYFCIHNLKSNIANYLVDNEKFYRLRDEHFKDITGTVSLKELTKTRNQKLFSDPYRKELNTKLLELYSILPKRGRLQYYSKNIRPYQTQLNEIIKFILLHDSVKYKYAKYLNLLDEHQKELNATYGNSRSNKFRNYYDNQVNKLYSKIGNEILNNYKIYKSMDYMEREKEFLKKHIYEFKFKSRPDYRKESTRKEIAKGLYKICDLADLNYEQTKKVFQTWLYNSKYKYDVDSLIASATTLDTRMSVSEYYDILKKLGYDSEKLSKFKEKHFYQELNYKKFIYKAMNYLSYELEQEEKMIINELEYELENFN